MKYNVKISDRFKLWLILFICFILQFRCSEKFSNLSTVQSRPNILFIISDDLSAEALGIYGNKQCLTPNIDRLARDGFLFTNAYCQYPVCGPSRAALMSGLYPEKLGIMSNGQSNRIETALGSYPSFPEHFRKNGYHTTRLSKIYHMRVPGDITAGVDGPDHKASWDEKYNFQGAEWMTKGVHEHLSNEKLKFDPEAHYNLGFGSAFYVVKGAADGSEQPDFRATTKAVEIIRTHKPGKDKPFFLSVGFVRPHVPLVAPKSAYFPYPSEKIDLPQQIEKDLDDIPKMGIPKTSITFGITEKKKQQKVISAYYASVSFMDAQVGRLLDAIEAHNLSEHTIVIFTSDHGYHLGEHDFWQKLSLHEESTRIPLIIRGPGIHPSRSSALSEQIDIFPSLCTLAGIPIPSHVQGKSLMPIITGKEKSVKQVAYCVTAKGAMIRTSEWTFIQYIDGTEELYDMKNDLHQFQNLASDSAYQEIRLKLKEILRAKQKEVVNTT